MNGIFSAHPCQSSIRLLVGTHLLLLVQAALVLWSVPIDSVMQALVLLIFVLGIAAFICAVRGLDDDERHDWWRRRHGR